MDALLETVKAQETDNSASATLDIYEAQHERYTRRVYSMFYNALLKQLEPAIAYIRDNPTLTPPLDALIDPSVMRLPIIQAYNMIGVTAARREYYVMRGTEKGLIDFLVEKWRRWFFEYATNYAYRIDNELAETTKDEIRQALAEAYEQQLSGNQIASYIYKKVGRKISRERATLIARTETATASNLGKEQGAKSWLGDEKGYKQWLGRVARERHSHRELNNTIIPMDESWEMNIYKGTPETGLILIGTETANLPGDAKLSKGNRINCRCTVRYLTQRMVDRLGETFG